MGLKPKNKTRLKHTIKSQIINQELYLNLKNFRSCIHRNVQNSNNRVLRGYFEKVVSWGIDIRDIHGIGSGYPFVMSNYGRKKSILMKVHKEIFIEALPYKPYAYEFIGDEFILFHSGASSVVFVYSTKGDFIKLIKQHSNGKRNTFKIVGNRYFSFGNVLYDRNFEPSKKKFKASKKSVEKYYPTYTPKYNQKTDSIVVGFLKGIIGFYDEELKPIEYKELDKDEVLIHISDDEDTLYSYNEKKGILSKFQFPNFNKLSEYKLPKNNNNFIFTDKHIFNYGYTSTNVVIDLSTDKVKNIQFHPTRKKGYKEQYNGAHNFGTSWATLNKNNKCEILACTDKSKAVIYNLESEESIELKGYEVLGFSPFEYHKDKHMHRGLFKNELIYTNFGGKFILWDRKGNAKIVQENIDEINIDANEQVYSLTDDNLYKIRIE